MTVRSACLLLLAVAGCAPGAPGVLPQALQAAAANYPPMILNGNVHGTSGEPPRSCAAAGAKVEQKGGPTLLFGGADASNPDLCVMTAEGQTFKAWYGIWLTDWPGAAQAYPAMRQVMTGPSGTLAGFDVNMTPALQYHDLIRNEGVEDILLLGKSYHALKISHYREGFGSNVYRSVSTVWKDIPTGLLVYATYNHISGKPELDDPLIPTAIIPAP